MPDFNFKSYADVCDVVIPAATVFDPETEGKGRIDDVLKFSNARRARGRYVKAIGGRENPVDHRRRTHSRQRPTCERLGARALTASLLGPSRGAPRTTWMA
jgi:hypothetical protein